MREILFKAKIKHSEEWIKGYYIGCIAGCYFLLTQDREEVLIDIETLSQYTGLKDKNGVKIFENDILLADEGEEYEIILTVEMRSGCWLLFSGGVNRGFLVLATSRSKVIGNRFDNAELLHGKE